MISDSSESIEPNRSSIEQHHNKIRVTKATYICKYNERKTL